MGAGVVRSGDWLAFGVAPSGKVCVAVFRGPACEGSRWFSGWPEVFEALGSAPVGTMELERWAVVAPGRMGR